MLAVATEVVSVPAPAQREQGRRSRRSRRRRGSQSCPGVGGIGDSRRLLPSRSGWRPCCSGRLPVSPPLSAAQYRCVVLVKWCETTVVRKLSDQQTISVRTQHIHTGVQ